MNETVLALMSALAIYGLSSLALPRPSSDTQADTTGIPSAEETATPVPSDDDKTLA
jgi:hypothetical protein